MDKDNDLMTLCIRMHDHFKFPATLDKCYILSKGHFL